MANAPEKRFRIGYINAAVWKNADGYYSATIQRSYKDGDGNWQQTDSFGHADIFCVMKALERAEEYISQHSTQQ